MEGCKFSKIYNDTFNPEWIMSRGVQCRRIILPDLDRPLRKEFLQYLHKSPVESIDVDTDTYKYYCIDRNIHGAYTKKIVGNEMETLWIDLAEFCPNLKELVVGNDRRSTCTFSDIIFSLFGRFLSTCGQLKSVTLNRIVNLPTLFLDAICSALCLENLHLDRCTLNNKDERIAETLFFRRNTTVTSFVCCEETVCMCTLFPCLQTLEANMFKSDSVVTIYSCPLLITARLNFASENAIVKLDKNIIGKWPMLQSLGVKLLWRNASLPESTVMNFVANIPSLVAIAPMPMSTFAIACKYPLHYKGSRLTQLNMRCDDAASLATIITQCPYLHTLYLQADDRKMAMESTISYSLVEQSLHFIVGTNIKVLSLSRYTHITNDNLKQLKHANLHTFRLKKCGAMVTNDGITQVLPTMSNLKTIEINQCESLTHDLVLQLPLLCAKLCSFTFVNLHCCAYSHRSEAPTLFGKILRKLYPSVLHWNIVC